MKSFINDKFVRQFHSSAYTLLEKIGEGGFGHVYRARQINTGQIVAIKFLSISSDFDDAKRARYIERFERETLLGSRLQHPNIVRLLDKGECDDLLYAVFEYIEGKTLKETLADSGSLSAVETADIMAQVLDALAHAHEQGVIHRDIKPANIMLSVSGTKTHAKVLDFGIGTLVNEARVQDYKSITLTQETLGTPSYSSPEQLRGEPPTLKTDIYVWGLVFIECLTAQAAMSGSNLASVFHKQLSQANVPLPSAIVGHPIAALLRRVLQKKVHERSVNATELYQELKKINFSNLVGQMESSEDHALVHSGCEQTVIHENSLFSTGLTERKQLTVLAICLNAKSVAGENIDHEVVDTLYRDQKNQCLDTAIRYGAFHVGTLGDTLLFYFGYPAVSDNDSRLCARSALDMVSSLHKRNALLKSSQGIQLDIKVAIHTGLVTCYSDAVPEGDTANTALHLVRMADKNQILCSQSSQTLLVSYIEFEPLPSQHLGIESADTALFSLIAERHVEAFGFLRSAQNNYLFIGREKELEVLTSLLNKKATTNDNRLKHIYGEAGIGKSRLIFEFRNHARDKTHYIAQCLPEHQNNALYPILNLLKQHYSLDVLKSESAILKLTNEVKKLTELNESEVMPVLCSWLGYALPQEMAISELSPDLQKQVLFSALIGLLVSQDNSKQANLFIFEDMHWADPTSIEFIARLSAAPQFISSQDIFVSTSRVTLPQTLEQADFELINLVKLSLQDSSDFVRNLFDKKNVSSDLLDVVVKRTDGIPLFIEELVDMLKQKKLVRHLNGITDFVSADKMDLVPNSLRDSLQQKLDSLIYAKETAQLAAAIGREFDYELLVEASSRSEAQLQTDLNELIEAELIYLRRKVRGDRYIFKHALVRDAAYESVGKENIRSLHLKIADTLNNNPKWNLASNLTMMANHFSLGSEFYIASSIMLKAINNSVKLASYHEAQHCFECTQKWLENLDNSDKVLRLDMDLHEAIFPALVAQEGMGAPNVALIGIKMDSIENKLNSTYKRNSSSKFISNWAKFQDLHFCSETNKAHIEGTSLIEGLRKENKKQYLLVVLAQFAQVDICRGDLNAAITAGKEVLDTYDIEIDREIHLQFGWDPKCVALSQMSHAYGLLGEISKSLICIEKANKHAELLGSEIDLDIICAFETLVYYLIRDKKIIQNKTVDLHDDRDWAKDNWYKLFIQLAKDWSESKTEISKSFSSMILSANRGGPFFYWLPMWLETEINKGNYGEMKKIILPLIELSEEKGLFGPIPFLLRTLALIEVETGNADAGEKLFIEALKGAEKQNAPMIFQDIVTHYARFLIKEKRIDESNLLIKNSVSKITMSERAYLNNHEIVFH